MKTARARILAAVPYGGYLRKTEPVDDQDVVEALEHLSIPGLTDRDGARVAAFAQYAGLTEEVRPIVLRANLEEVLKLELTAQRARQYNDPERFADAISNGGTEMGIVKVLNDPEVGWALAVLALVDEFEPSVLARLVASKDDPAQLIPMYLIIRGVDIDDQGLVLQRLLGANDQFTLACAEVLLMDWIRNDILGGRRTPADRLTAVAAAPKPRALSLFGALLDDLSRWFDHVRLDEDSASRAKLWQEKIDLTGRAIIVQPNDVDRVLKAAGRRDVQALAAMAHWQSDPNFPSRLGERIAGHARALFLREFGSAMKLNASEHLYDVAHPEWVTASLIEALTHAGLSIEDFQAAYAGLASDAFSRMTRFAVWLRDRPKAICLLAVAGYVAHRRSDKELLEAVKRAAIHAESQPAHNSVYDDEAIASINEQLGFPIPQG